MTNKSKALEQLATAYEDQPVIRALIQVALAPIPYGIGSAIDDALTTALRNMREKRLQTFFDELASGKHKLTEELIKREEFLHAYFATLKAAVNSRRTEKIKLFARLLLNSADSNNVDSETYEEFLNILDDLSIRELHILLILKQFEDVHPHEIVKTNDDDGKPGNDLQRANLFWEEFEDTIKQKLNLEQDELRATLTRLNRTGLYETITGTFFGYTGGRGKLTPLFFKFVDWLQIKEEEIRENKAA
jgi:hypothetical protein